MKTGAAPLTLRPDVTVSGDIVTFGDLVSGLGAREAALPAFRAPALGETGTIQAARTLEAARANNLPEIVTASIGQTIVTRAPPPHWLRRDRAGREAGARSPPQCRYPLPCPRL